MNLIASFDEFMLHLRAFMARALEGGGVASDLESEFNRLALALFALQRDAIPIYGKFCGKCDAATVQDWREIPALPTAAFKEFDVTSLPPEDRARVFHSSGTTRQRPSQHFHNGGSLEIYEASLRSWFQQHFLNGTSSAGQFRLVVLTPAVKDAPHSSLVHMFDTVQADFDNAIFTGRVDGEGTWTVDVEQTLAALRETQSAGRPVALLGTAASFVLVLDHCRASQTRFRLPPGSRVLETGGYKGRGRMVSKGELRVLMERWLGLPESHILAEYGMSELGSQAYDRVLPEKAGGFRFPQWARARIISPETGRDAADGETGLVRIYDLANVRSVLAVQTEDLAVRRGDGFELTGRAAHVPARGCSLQLQEL